ncbi:MAG: phenylalanine--tRNA ligase subunit beta [Candidatus Methanogaster sp.]|uniref:Phenylalanine--tRNA ligase subunit beta n=1 Tax=Candidatus Methanogaster sp. TaxID=3386292 RepID=A0AC61L5Y1_9EURY|nr:MAG: phenylalanine--tRNA ligase subunit beta [ANME-2 cluster archaeon]
MPVITLYYTDLENLIGTDRDTVLDRIPMIGADIERVYADYVDIEFFPDRPDLYSVEGVARAMRGFLDIETGIPEYVVGQSGITITSDHEIGKIRPHLACAVVKGIKFTPYSIESLMSLQEDLHWGIGRNRSKVSIGVHDLDRVTPPFEYIAADPTFEFVPLDFDLPMSMDEILDKHPKGVKFAHLVEKFDKYPLIIDSYGTVLSFPPIINGTLTRVRDDTKDLFIEVTGTDKSVSVALNIVTTALAERGGKIESVKIQTPDTGYTTPNLDPATRRISASGANALLGLTLSRDQIMQYLGRMRFGAVPLSQSDDAIEVSVPAYRADIMHDYDIFEDVAIGYGYEKITSVLPETMTIGEEHPISLTKADLRDIMVGLGFYEVMPFTLTSESVHFEKMRRPHTSATRVMHPITVEQTMLRTTIFPNLLEILSFNQHRELPQRIFEVGDVVASGRNAVHLAAVAIDPHANFSEIRSIVDAVMHERVVAYEITESDDPAFIDGRRADIIVDGGRRAGVFGEVHPGVILNFGLDQPVIGFEMWGL